MRDYIAGLIDLATDGDSFMEVMATGDKSQVVIMSIKPGEEIRSSVDAEHEEILINIEGEGRVVLNGMEGPFDNGDLVIVRPGSESNFTNTGAIPMKIIVVYTPSRYENQTIHKTKKESDDAEDQDV
jgi:mannose-6-phosphate isomerase-like protein (cupin superfamily)